MIELVERAAAADPQRLAVVTHEVQMTYGELHARALRVADELSSRGISRFAVLDHEAADVLALLAGASAAGAEACLYPPAEPRETAALLGRFDHAVLVSADALAPDSAIVAEVVAPDDLGVCGEGPGTRSRGGPATSTAPGAARSGRPHLVLTTGTTGEPKGVRHDWERLLRGVRRVQPAPEERWLLAYGLHQFAGLQVLLHVMAAGATLVAPAPRRPREGLRAMRELGVTHASATPTYWRFLLAELAGSGGPAPALRQVTLGGEAIPATVLAHLREAFPDASVSQVYAASEFGSTGSMRDGRAGLSLDSVERGDQADTDLRIIDGELWVRSRTGMLGYYGEPPVEDPDGWRRTGDLVEVVDGRVVFRGRASEVINVGGVKVHPLPIEERIGAVPGVAVARVWGRPNPMTGAIVAVDLVLTGDADPDRTRTAVREACLDLPGAAQPRSIRVVDDITTKDSKIVRQV